MEGLSHTSQQESQAPEVSEAGAHSTSLHWSQILLPTSCSSQFLENYPPPPASLEVRMSLQCSPLQCVVSEEGKREDGRMSEERWKHVRCAAGGPSYDRVELATPGPQGLFPGEP